MTGERLGILILAAAVLCGCSRSHHRQRADADAYALLEQKTAATPWEPPPQYAVEPHPASRLAIPGKPDDPLLPMPSPQLYAYRLPPLPNRDAERFLNSRGDVPQPLPLAEPVVLEIDDRGATPLRQPSAVATDHVRVASHAEPVDRERPVRTARRRQLDLPGPQAPEASATAEPIGDGEITVVPLPASVWEAIPLTCRRRLFDFESLREQYELTYGPSATYERDDAPRLSLEDIVEVGLLNSREYQTQKEILYRVALRLSLERFDYQLKFSPTGNRTTVDFQHDRRGGFTTNQLAVPTTLQAEKALLTGGDMLARFANNVLLTFNGPQGFAADVSSEVLLGFSQSVFQRDIRFEPLTQAERNLVYAARDYARYRKTFFTGLATDYYNLVRQYRQIEIDAQNYFSLARAFHQTQAEYRAGLVPRFQLDQVEQQVLGGRRRLTETCNRLEQAMDNLKLQLGLPTEMPLNLDLTELNQLTLRDQLAVAAELIDRVRVRLATERSAELPNRVVLLSTTVVLLDRIVEAHEIQETLGMAPIDVSELLRLRARLDVESTRLYANELRDELDDELGSVSPSLPIVFQRTMDLIEALLEVIDRQLELAELLGRSSDEIANFRMRAEMLHNESSDLRHDLQELINTSELGQLAQLVERAEQLRTRNRQLVEALDQLNGMISDEVPAEVALQETLADVDRMLGVAEDVLQQIGGGLPPVKVDVDDAMMTALVLRLDLMNQRGTLADDWRQIKLAADELKSFLNLNASQVIRTRADVNRPFDFTWDESSTNLRLTFDAPLNRRAQRNSYRLTLLDYQQSLRQLTALEDRIKLDVRNVLRDLALDQEQYLIDVASAALAFERVVSTQLEFRLGGRVSARDFLEAQNDYTNALSGVAERHINYIVDRMDLFFTLELLTVGEDGFWGELYNLDHQPEPYYQLPPWALPAYGELPHVWYSKEIRRMEHVPPGTAAIHHADDDAELLPVPELP